LVGLFIGEISFWNKSYREADYGGCSLR